MFCTKRTVVSNALKVFFVLLLASTLLSAAPRLSHKEEMENTFREIRNHLRDTRHEIRNHEEEIRSFEAKLKNQDATVEGLREEMLALNKEEKKEMEQNLTLKISSLELATKGLVSDCKQLKEHFNKTVQMIQTQEQKVIELNKMIEAQNENISNLESALRSIMEAFQLRGESEKGSLGGVTKVYRVQSGDSLEKIAKQNQTSVQAIKEMNQLTNDRIIVGQKLQLP